MSEEEFLERIRGAIQSITDEFKVPLEPGYVRDGIADKAALVVRLDIRVDYPSEAQQELPFEKPLP